MFSKPIFCSKFALKGKTCSRLLKPQKGAQKLPSTIGIGLVPICRNYTAKYDYLCEPRFHADVFNDMRSIRLLLLIQAGSISENVRHRDVSNLAKFHAFIKKRPILVLSSWTMPGV